MSERTRDALSYLCISRISYFLFHLLHQGTLELCRKPFGPGPEAIRPFMAQLPLSQFTAEDVQLGEASDDAGLPFEPTSFHPCAPETQTLRHP